MAGSLSRWTAAWPSSRCSKGTKTAEVLGWGALAQGQWPPHSFGILWAGPGPGPCLCHPRSPQEGSAVGRVHLRRCPPGPQGLCPLTSTHMEFLSQPLPFPLGESHKLLFIVAVVHLFWAPRPLRDLYLVFIKFESYYVKFQTQGKVQSNIMNASIFITCF